MSDTDKPLPDPPESRFISPVETQDALPLDPVKEIPKENEPDLFTSPPILPFYYTLPSPYVRATSMPPIEPECSRSRLKIEIPDPYYPRSAVELPSQMTPKFEPMPLIRAATARADLQPYMHRELPTPVLEGSSSMPLVSLERRQSSLPSLPEEEEDGQHPLLKKIPPPEYSEFSPLTYLAGSDDMFHNTEYGVPAISYWEPLQHINHWSTLAYVILWSPLWSVFCFMWVLSSALLCGITVIAPPIFFILMPLAYSWRMLGVLELGMVKVLPRLSTATSPCVRCPVDRPRVFQISDIPHSQQWQFPLLNHTVRLFTSPFTLRCLLYFIIIKPALSITFFLIGTVCVAIAIPFWCTWPIVLRTAIMFGVCERWMAETMLSSTVRLRQRREEEIGLMEDQEI